MNRGAILAALPTVALLVCDACASFPGAPRPGSEVVAPSEVVEFRLLYGQNCAGCHGANGKGGAAIALANPVGNRRRQRDSPYRSEWSAWHFDARLCTERRWNAHRQADRCTCA